MSSTGLLSPERGCDLQGCRETYNRDGGDYYEVKTPEDLAFGSRYCSVNCAKIALMREERGQDGDSP